LIGARLLLQPDTKINVKVSDNEWQIGPIPEANHSPFVVVEISLEGIPFPAKK
jgi:hypothetical protein